MIDFKRVLTMLLMFVSLLFGTITYNEKEYVEDNFDIILDGNTARQIVVAGSIEYFNSWSAKKILINNVNYTNTYSNSYPEKINGMYFIDYIAKNKFSHFEMVGITNWDDTLNIEEPTVDTLKIYMLILISS